MKDKNPDRIKENVFWKFVDIIAYWNKGIANIYNKIIGKEYIKEEEKFDFLNVKNILHIGCGSYPISAITLARNNNRKIVTIDRDAKSIKRAMKIVTKKNLEKNIKADIGNGIEYSLDNFDLIIVSGCSVPRYDVVNHIFKNSQPGTKIIVRKEVKEDGWFKELLDKYEKIEVLDNMINNPHPFCKWNSVFLIKN